MPRRPLYYDVFETALGWVAAVTGDRGVVRMSLPERSVEIARDRVRPEVNAAQLDPERLAELRGLVESYCMGEDVDLGAVPIDSSSASPFFAKAWEACRSIPRGETRSYGWLAAAAGSPRAARGAGQAMARNRVALLVPCHRVIAATGALHGFGGSEGLVMKERLLRLEANGRAGRISPTGL
jgi:methylated-DNA-[protein]-cysteine S-methyltransferase